MIEPGASALSNLLILDSVTHLKPEHRARAAYCASHGGVYAAYYAAKLGIGALIVNDAGVGRDRAGIAGLGLLDSLGVPAAAISYQSARIGDGNDGLARGVLSLVNAAAKKIGLFPELTCADALRMLSSRALTPAPLPMPIRESRFNIREPAHGACRVIGVDSNGLVTATDVGAIVITGSHGGLLGGSPATAIKFDARAAVFNDAGIGIDNAGVSRLAALDARGIAGACVSYMSARIGDARSTYEDGVISAVNATAAGLGGNVGQTCKEFVRVIAV